ncbi:MAG TPA: hypothetical protein PLT82_05480 [Candidatus Hydrogenedens sp.]|nr:hypothetical protein [Candidatus Hydrogenedens sp.]HOK10242.1 hypothetical protein [Candidatus Hydrogenedens sp.]HOL20143.1 hypothetical protein [Candidatus Hydrogenedens sp.]HPP58565.1 hypothetical protein [Candidatus Hydrogenedens sp.]
MKHVKKLSNTAIDAPKRASSAEAMFFYLYFTVISFMLSAAFAEKVD